MNMSASVFMYDSFNVFKEKEMREVAVVSKDYVVDGSYDGLTMEDSREFNRNELMALAVFHAGMNPYLVNSVDYSVVRWGDLSAMDLASIYTLIGTVLASPGLDAVKYHELMVKHAEKSGWRYGPIFDMKYMTDPVLAPYNELTVQQKAGLNNFLRIVRGLDNTLPKSSETTYMNKTIYRF